MQIESISEQVRDFPRQNDGATQPSIKVDHDARQREDAVAASAKADEGKNDSADHGNKDDRNGSRIDIKV